MKYIELTVHTTTEASELVADAMWSFTDGGVAVCDVNDIVALQKDSTVFWDYIDESLTQARLDVLVKCFVAPENVKAIQDILNEVEARKAACAELNFGTLEATKREIEGDDWIDIWKKHFRPIPIGNIVIVPEWISYQKKDGERVVLIDSNMAFGTGEHETTSMCVELMQRYLRQGDVCIDVGCGSGILGISAIKLGAGFCYLSDLDPIAVKSSLHNAALNKVQDSVRVTEANLLDGSTVSADIIFANITAEVLKLLAPEIPNALKTGGILILSGILSDRTESVIKAFTEVGMQILEKMQKGEWVSLVLKKG